MTNLSKTYFKAVVVQNNITLLDAPEFVKLDLYKASTVLDELKETKKVVDFCVETYIAFNIVNTIITFNHNNEEIRISEKEAYFKRK